MITISELDLIASELELLADTIATMEYFPEDVSEFIEGYTLALLKRAKELCPALLGKHPEILAYARTINKNCSSRT